MELGEEMYEWATDLFPINRSLTGPGVRETLIYLKNIIPELEIKAVKSGTKVFDWVVPEEWEVSEAYIEDDKGKKIINFSDNNLHLVGYSIAVNKRMNLEDLKQKLHTLPLQPNAIPYITSYYKRDWGFCMNYNQFKELRDCKYHVVVKSKFSQGVLNFGEIYFPGDSKEEVLLSTYICHPSMANNELSGPVVALQLAKWIKSLKNHRFSYRILFVAETIGSISYLSLNDNYLYLKKYVKAGFQITCVGDNNNVSYLPSRNGNTLVDKIVKYVLKNYIKDYQVYSFLDRGSDERQWCAPGIDLPIASLIRTKYGEYPEYHTSLDDLTLISPEGLEGGFNNIKLCIKILENNCVYKYKNLCEPQLGKRGLYPNTSTKNTRNIVASMMNVLAYCDGNYNLLEVSEIINVDFFECVKIVETLCKKGLLERINEKHI